MLKDGALISHLSNNIFKKINIYIKKKWGGYSGTPGPEPLSDTVQRSDQLLWETSGADPVKSGACNFIVFQFPVETGQIIRLSLKRIRALSEDLLFVIYNPHPSRYGGGGAIKLHMLYYTAQPTMLSDVRHGCSGQRRGRSCGTAANTWKRLWTSCKQGSN